MLWTCELNGPVVVVQLETILAIVNHRVRHLQSEKCLGEALGFRGVVWIFIYLGGFRAFSFASSRTLVVMRRSCCLPRDLQSLATHGGIPAAVKHSMSPVDGSQNSSAC